MRIEEKFSKGEEFHTYLRVDPDYKVNIFLGYNDDGQMSMVITEYGSVTNVNSSKVIDVQMKKREDGRTALSFDLLDGTYKSMFLIFCKDMIVVCEKAGNEMAISNAVTRWKYWREMFGKRKSTILDKQEIKGLIGELLELRDHFIRDYGQHEAISSWMGPLSGHKDFEIEDTWYEVKSVNENALQVSINSLEQLEADTEGHLVVIRLEDTSMAATNSINLNKLVMEIINRIEDLDDLDAFRIKLDNIGYCSDPEYDNYNFKFKGTRRFLVGDGFPRIRRNEVSPSIGSVKYTILLDGITSFEED